MTIYTDFKFTAKGINFISRVNTEHPIYQRIASLPEGAFTSINIQAVEDLLSLKEYSIDEIKAELDRVNEGGSYAFILLDEESN